MNLIFLAAGFATRLEPLTLDRPKHLLPVGGGIFIDLLINQLRKVESEFSKKVLITNNKYFNDFQAWQSSTDFKMDIFNDGVNSKDEKLGAIGDLRSIMDQAEIEGDSFILAIDYVLQDFNFQKLFNFIKEKKSSVTLAKKESDNDVLRAGSCLELNDQEQITRFEEKPLEPFSDLYGAPYYFVKGSDLELLKSIPKNLWDNSGQIVAKLLKDSKIYGFQTSGKDLHMTTLKDYEQIKALYEN